MRSSPRAEASSYDCVPSSTPAMVHACLALYSNTRCRPPPAVRYRSTCGTTQPGTAPWKAVHKPVRCLFRILLRRAESEPLIPQQHVGRRPYTPGDNHIPQFDCGSNEEAHTHMQHTASLNVLIYAVLYTPSRPPMNNRNTLYRKDV